MSGRGLVGTGAADAIGAYCRANIGDPATYSAPRGYPDGLALCVIDAVQSTGVRYPSVENVTLRYLAYRANRGADGYRDAAPDLLATFVELGGTVAWAAAIGNQHRISTQPGAPLKAFAVHAAAVALQGAGVASTADLRAAVAEPARRDAVRAVWIAVPGQRSGITWHYVQMLAGVPGVKPDRMITRFVAQVLDLPTRALGADLVVDLVTAAADALGISATTLDHAIWQWQRRPRGRKAQESPAIT